MKTFSAFLPKFELAILKPIKPIAMPATATCPVMSMHFCVAPAPGITETSNN